MFVVVQAGRQGEVDNPTCDLQCPGSGMMDNPYLDRRSQYLHGRSDAVYHS